MIETSAKNGLANKNFVLGTESCDEANGFFELFSATPCSWVFVSSWVFFDLGIHLLKLTITLFVKNPCFSHFYILFFGVPSCSIEFSCFSQSFRKTLQPRIFFFIIILACCFSSLIECSSEFRWSSKTVVKNICVQITPFVFSPVLSENFLDFLCFWQQSLCKNFSYSLQCFLLSSCMFISSNKFLFGKKCLLLLFFINKDHKYTQIHLRFRFSRSSLFSHHFLFVLMFIDEDQNSSSKYKFTITAKFFLSSFSLNVFSKLQKVLFISDASWWRLVVFF